MKFYYSFVFLILTGWSLACTTFVLKDDNQFIFGRNLDWVSDDGVIVTNQRGITKNSLVFGNDRAVNWISKYGSVTFNQFGKEFPFGGMNEAGLVVEVMVVPGTYPKPDDRFALNELQWVQYQLDNAETINEVIQSDAFIRISGVSQNLHYLVCDRTGKVAVIEFDAKGMIVYQGNDLIAPVLENDPYATSIMKLKKGQNCRFKKVVSMLEAYSPNNKTSAIDYSFSILDKVALDGSWSIVYDVKNKQVFYKTKSHQSRKWFSLSQFDFGCHAQSSMFDLLDQSAGNVSSKFSVFNPKLNATKLRAAITSNGIVLPKDIEEQFLGYHATCTCAQTGENE